MQAFVDQINLIIAEWLFSNLELPGYISLEVTPPKYVMENGKVSHTTYITVIYRDDQARKGSEFETTRGQLSERLTVLIEKLSKTFGMATFELTFSDNQQLSLSIKVMQQDTIPQTTETKAIEDSDKTLV